VRTLGTQNVNGQSQNEIEKFRWDVLDHPPYSPDLAPSNFQLFLHLKKHLAGKKLDYDDEVHQEIMAWIKSMRQTFITLGYGSWFKYLINVWTMPVTMLKNKVM
jgi:hypothetical protein